MRICDQGGTDPGRPPLVLIGFVLVDCEVGDPMLAPPSASPETALAIDAAPPHALRVLNWNVYIGADVDAVIGALASPDPPTTCRHC